MKDKTPHNHEGLSERQQVLLMALHDGECGLVANWRARRLLARSSDAADFLAGLARLAREVEASSAHVPALESSLWEGIARRIEQEERAALYLGQRSDRRVPVSFSRRIAVPLGWSVAGGLVAACFTVFFLNSIPASAPYQQGGVSGQLVRRDGDSRQAEVPVRLVSQSSDLPRIIEPVGAALDSNGKFVRSGKSSRVDVDWVHSDGSVRFFSDPGQRSTMIWVKKRSPAVRFYSPPARRSSEASDGTPRILDKQIPQSLSVSNR